MHIYIYLANTGYIYFVNAKIALIVFRPLYDSFSINYIKHNYIATIIAISIHSNDRNLTLVHVESISKMISWIALILIIKINFD